MTFVRANSVGANTPTQRLRGMVMYKLKYDDTVEYFEDKDEAKDAAQQDRVPYVLKWKVLKNKKGKKIGAKSGKYRITKVKSKDIGTDVLKAGPGPAALDDPRTVREFVEDMIGAGRRHLGIRAVAQSCRWEHHMPAINAILKEFPEK